MTFSSSLACLVSAYLSFISRWPRIIRWLSSVASILSNRASVAWCSALSASNQSPIAPVDIWTNNLRPMLAARPIAAPASAALARTPALPPPQEKALFSPERVLLLEPLERLLVLVSLAIRSSFGDVGPRNRRGGAPVPAAGPTPLGKSRGASMPCARNLRPLRPAALLVRSPAGSIASPFRSGAGLDTKETAMKALVWHGKQDIRHETVPDPVIEEPKDAII